MHFIIVLLIFHISSVYFLVCIFVLQELIEAANSLKATCNTLLSNTDELIRLLFNSGRFKAAIAASNPDGSPANPKKPSALPQSLQNDKPKSRKNSTNSRFLTLLWIIIFHSNLAKSAQGQHELLNRLQLQL